MGSTFIVDEGPRVHGVPLTIGQLKSLATRTRGCLEPWVTLRVIRDREVGGWLIVSLEVYPLPDREGGLVFVVYAGKGAVSAIQTRRGQPKVYRNLETIATELSAVFRPENPNTHIQINWPPWRDSQEEPVIARLDGGPPDPE